MLPYGSFLTATLGCNTAHKLLTKATHETRNRNKNTDQNVPHILICSIKWTKPTKTINVINNSTFHSADLKETNSHSISTTNYKSRATEFNRVVCTLKEGLMLSVVWSVTNHHQTSGIGQNRLTTHYMFATCNIWRVHYTTVHYITSLSNSNRYIMITNSNTSL